VEFGKLRAVRASRLVAILLLEVSERTIYRDVQSLTAAGVPVYGEAVTRAATGWSTATAPG
jgi:predicted DNA-binding transcriptional regulator YafY